MGTFVLVLLFGSGYMITNSFVVNHLVTGHTVCFKHYGPNPRPEIHRQFAFMIKLKDKAIAVK